MSVLQAYGSGCVGLGRAEVPILKVPYSREDYFVITGLLMAALSIGGTP